MSTKTKLLLGCATLFCLVPWTAWSGRIEQLSAPLAGQTSGMGADQAPRLPGERNDPADEMRSRAEKEMAKKANQERQAELKRDTEHLLKLATELQQYVDKSNENVLSLDVVKTAAEIEKLAHSVKEKMKTR